MVTVVPLTRLLVNNPIQQRNFMCLRLFKRQVNIHVSNSHSFVHTRCLSLCLRTNSSSSLCNNSGDRMKKLLSQYQINKFSTKSSATHCHESDEKNPSTPPPPATAKKLFGEAANKGLFAKFKHMYKQYWYVVIPIHVITSIGWFGGFYYLSKNGVDVPALLQYIHLSESTIESIGSSDAGHYAFSYLCYNTATPVRYALTLGCSTVSIKYLS